MNRPLPHPNKVAALAAATLRARSEHGGGADALRLFNEVRRVHQAASEPAADDTTPHDVVLDPIDGVAAGNVIDIIMPALLATRRPLRVQVRGATHATDGPSYPFLRYALQPHLNRLGFDVGFELNRTDFTGSIDGQIVCHATPAQRRDVPTWGHPGRFLSLRCEILIGRWAFEAAQRQLKVLRDEMHSAGWPLPAVTVREIDHPRTPGNAVTVRAICTSGEGVFTQVCQEGDDPDEAATAVARQAMGWLASGVAVQRRLARRLLVPLAMADGGRFVTIGRDDPRLTSIASHVAVASGLACRLIRHRERLVVEMNRD
jgi:RNA 3'-terminal phosphate cyclase